MSELNLHSTSQPIGKLPTFRDAAVSKTVAALPDGTDQVIAVEGLAVNLALVSAGARLVLLRLRR